MDYTIYKTTNIINGKYYIGMHKTKDIHDRYLGSGKLLSLAINKYGAENFTKEILHICDSEQHMIEKEIELVDETFIARSDTYNLNVGGCGWPSGTKRGTQTKEHVRKRAESNRGQKRTIETRKKMSEKLKGRSVPWSKGIPNVKVHKQIILDGTEYSSYSEAAEKIGVNISTISDWAQKGFTVVKKNRHMKSLMINGVEYVSQAEAAKELGIHSDTIRRWIKKGKIQLKENI